MKLIINLEDGYDIEAEIKVDKRGFALIEEFANSLALPSQTAKKRGKKPTKEKGEWVRLADSLFPKRRR